MGILATDFDTHAPEAWAEELLDDLVPTIAECSLTGLLKIQEAKAKLRPHVIALVASVREAERNGFLALTPDENIAVASAYRFYHGFDTSGEHFHTLHKDVKGKLRSSAVWADRFVANIVRTACEIDGNIGSNSMADEVYRILDNWINSIQLCERSHHVSSNKLHLA